MKLRYIVQVNSPSNVLIIPFLDWKVLKFSDEEHFEGDISFDILEEDLDEGYSYNNNISRPEHTPEIGLPLTERKKEDSPHKQELSQSISK